MKRTSLLVLGVSLIYATLASTGLCQPSPSETPEAVATRIRDFIVQIRRQPQPTLYDRHLESVLALCEAELVRLRLAGKDRQDQTRELLGYLLTIEAGLRDDGSRAATYLVEGRRALTMARLSKLDDSLQFYTVSLPPHWEPDTPYPLHVQLHGAGPRMPLAYVNYTFQPHQPLERLLPLALGPSMIVLCPWMRGNHPWCESSDSEADLWEAVDDVKNFARIDPDRCYISGHSGGADATWAIVQRTPDLWAAAGMLAGATYGAPVDLGLVGNASHVPFYIWSGDQDPTNRLPSAKEARDALAAVGNPPKFVIAPGVGHMYRWVDMAAMTAWLATQTRRRPEHFSFVVDTPRHRGIWGISVPRKYPYDQLVAEPRVQFECWIKGSTVEVKTWDAKTLVVDCGPTGLNLGGTVTLIVNGKERFAGPAADTPVSLDL